jgi:ornithine cyclodeaminase/alanine dehydrogenase-like protein (mu-crystallin family)
MCKACLFSQESGDIIMSGCQIKSELGSVLDKGPALQHDPHTVTVFKSLGLAVEDVVAGRLVLDLLDSQQGDQRQ